MTFFERNFYPLFEGQQEKKLATDDEKTLNLTNNNKNKNKTFIKKIVVLKYGFFFAASVTLNKLSVSSKSVPAETFKMIRYY